jgi:hypothetical protein
MCLSTTWRARRVSAGAARLPVCRAAPGAAARRQLAAGARAAGGRPRRVQRALQGQFSRKKWQTTRSSPLTSAKNSRSPATSRYSPCPRASHSCGARPPGRGCCSCPLAAHAWPAQRAAAADRRAACRPATGKRGRQARSWPQRQAGCEVLAASGTQRCWRGEPARQSRRAPGAARRPASAGRPGVGACARYRPHPGSPVP